jgi:Na+/H+ antiporter NhaD/arsenite permease-like protein
MSADTVVINPWMMLPFAALLGMIALAPLFFGVWWGRHYPKVAFGLAGIALAYYFLGLHAAPRVWHTAHEYLSFIALVGSLYIVSGGIHINIKGEATPSVNAMFLLAGAVLANILGTTGASMLLIRPWLRMNRHRVGAYHVVFFIFLVSNVGGCLTPIGDPPLFLGYLAGIPFWWVAEHCLTMWTTGMGMLLAMFYFLDRRAFLRTPRLTGAESGHIRPGWQVDGLPNLFFLAVIIVAVFIDSPPLLREGLMVAAALGSWFTTPKSVHASNRFNFHPIEEVAILFAGIFATMMPALDWLEGNAGGLNGAGTSFFYWGCGSLSSLLDNAPTYLCFLKAISARLVDVDTVHQVNHLIQTHGLDLAGITGPHSEEIRQTWAALQKYFSARLAVGTVGTDEIEVANLLGHTAHNGYIVAISVAAVFFGANTYIGNGPNFMVKSIADQQKVPTPSFLSYIFKFTLPCMLPVLLVVWWVFFRR